MLNSLLQNITCEVCGHELVYNPKTTFEAYHEELENVIGNVELKVEEVIGELLIYECPKCECIYKYTYKEIERLIRGKITKQVLLSIARGQMKNMTGIMDGILIYCGKCFGFDGNGSCTKKMYDKCEVKKFPNGI
jgi:hypothetical protein